MQRFALLCSFLSMLDVTSSTTVICPVQCACDARIHSINCRARGKYTIPLNGSSLTKEFLLYWNNIKEVLSELRNYPNLEYLELSGNKIVSIEDGAFSSLSRLKVLSLDNNLITRINKNTFIGLISLMSLDLSNNQLKLIPALAFQDLFSLISLDLARNMIHDVDDLAFDGMTSLTNLNITHNSLSSIPKKALLNTNYVTKLYLNNNRIQRIDGDSFSSLKNLTILSLSGNNIKFIPMDAFRVSGNKYLPLERLCLRVNRITDIPTSALQNLTYLDFLDLSQNLFQIIHPDSFKGLLRLTVLYLNSLPYLARIEEGAIRNLLNLQELHISSNKVLKIINKKAFDNLPRLTWVYLNNNAIETFYEHQLNWLSLRDVDLSGNNLMCDCQLSWMQMVFIIHPNNITYARASVLMCDQPRRLRYHHVLFLHQNELRCMKPEKSLMDNHVVVGVSASICILSSLIVLFLIAKFRNRICNGVKKHFRYKRQKDEVFSVDHTMRDEDAPMSLNCSDNVRDIDL